MTRAQLVEVCLKYKMADLDSLNNWTTTQLKDVAGLLVDVVRAVKAINARQAAIEKNYAKRR